MIVPGGMIVPVMSVRGREGVIASQRCYVRKPGPRSEEPSTAEEWRGVMERCIAARRENMLDAIRIIVQGHGSPALAPVAIDAGQAGEQAAPEHAEGESTARSSGSVRGITTTILETRSFLYTEGENLDAEGKPL